MVTVGASPAETRTPPCDLTCDTIGGLECGRLADLRDLAADCLDLHTNRGL